MSAHNWVFLRSKDDFGVNFELLIEALSTDLSYVREQTRLLTRAIEWDENNRRRSNILRGPELIAAEGWLAISQSMQPASTELHDEYIAFSRTTIRRLQSLVYTGIGVAFVLLLGLALFAIFQRNEANNQRQLAVKSAEIAEERLQQAEQIARIATAQSLAALALVEVDRNPARSLILATKSVRFTYEFAQTVLPLSNTALRQSIIKSRVRLTLKGHGAGLTSASYSPDGQRMVTASYDKTAKV